MSWPAPQPDLMRAAPDGFCACGTCGPGRVLFRIAPSILECVVDRPIAQRVRAAHQVQTGVGS